jgi:hypothetical protein
MARRLCRDGGPVAIVLGRQADFAAQDLHHLAGRVFQQILLERRVVEAGGEVGEQPLRRFGVAVGARPDGLARAACGLAQQHGALVVRHGPRRRPALFEPPRQRHAPTHRPRYAVEAQRQRLDAGRRVGERFVGAVDTQSYLDGVLVGRPGGALCRKPARGRGDRALFRLGHLGHHTGHAQAERGEFGDGLGVGRIGGRGGRVGHERSMNSGGAEFQDVLASGGASRPVGRPSPGSCLAVTGPDGSLPFETMFSYANPVGAPAASCRYIRCETRPAAAKSAPPSG